MENYGRVEDHLALKRSARSAPPEMLLSPGTADGYVTSVVCCDYLQVFLYLPVWFCSLAERRSPCTTAFIIIILIIIIVINQRLNVRLFLMPSSRAVFHLQTTARVCGDGSLSMESRGEVPR